MFWNNFRPTENGKHYHVPMYLLILLSWHYGILYTQRTVIKMRRLEWMSYCQLNYCAYLNITNFLHVFFCPRGLSGTPPCLSCCYELQISLLRLLTVPCFFPCPPWLTLLQITGQVLCRMFLRVSLSDVLTWLEWGFCICGRNVTEIHHITTFVIKLHCSMTFRRSMCQYVKCDDLMKAGLPDFPTCGLFLCAY